MQLARQEDDDIEHFIYEDEQSQQEEEILESDSQKTEDDNIESDVQQIEKEQNILQPYYQRMQIESEGFQQAPLKCRQAIVRELTQSQLQQQQRQSKKQNHQRKADRSLSSKYVPQGQQIKQIIPLARPIKIQPSEVNDEKYYDRGRGRPPGSRNKTTLIQEEALISAYYDLDKKSLANSLYLPKTGTLNQKPIQKIKKLITKGNNDCSVNDRSRSRQSNVFSRKDKFIPGKIQTSRFTGTAREHIIEVPYQLMSNKRNRSKSKSRVRVDDTRSLFDDPHLQRMRMNTQKQVVTAIGGVLQEQERAKWFPIEMNQKVPRQFYMTDQFTLQSGVRNVRDGQVQTEYDAFRLFFDDEVQRYILSQTHQHYHKEFKKEVYFYCTEQTNIKPKYENDFSQSDIEGFVGLYLYFGVVKLRNTMDYWQIGQKSRANLPENEQNIMRFLDSKLRSQKESSRMLKQSRSCINQNMTRIMPYQKYKRLKGFFRYGPTGQKGNSDPIYKIRDLITLLNTKFSNYYQAGEFLALDEGMIPFNGRVKFKVFNPAKPTKWGIKEYVLTDATLPYTFLIKLHDGMEDDDEENEKNEVVKGKIANLVLQLVQDFEGKNHKLVMDNYYNSPALFIALKARGIGAIGTLRHNRTGLAQSDIKGDYFKKIFQNERIWYLSQDHQMFLLYFLSCANHPVAFLSSFIAHDQTSSAVDLHSLQLRPRKDEIPKVLTFYNKYKGGVDRRNAFCSFMRRKGENEGKWWRSVFWRLIETCVINAFVVFKQLHPEAYKNRTFQDFRISLMIQLASQYKENETVTNLADSYSWVQQQSWFKKDGHRMLKGISMGQCVQCRQEITDIFCQDCSIDANESINVCSKTFCRRFHKYSDFEMNKELFERNQCNYKTKKVKMQERKIADKSHQVRQLQAVTKKLEQEKLDLIVKKGHQLQNINDLMQKLRLPQKEDLKEMQISQSLNVEEEDINTTKLGNEEKVEHKEQGEKKEKVEHMDEKYEGNYDEEIIMIDSNPYDIEINNAKINDQQRSDGSESEELDSMEYDSY